MALGDDGVGVRGVGKHAQTHAHAQTQTQTQTRMRMHACVGGTRECHVGAARMIGRRLRNAAARAHAPLRISSLTSLASTDFCASRKNMRSRTCGHVQGKQSH